MYSFVGHWLSSCPSILWDCDMADTSAKSICSYSLPTNVLVVGASNAWLHWYEKYLSVCLSHGFPCSSRSGRGGVDGGGGESLVRTRRGVSVSCFVETMSKHISFTMSTVTISVATVRKCSICVLRRLKPLPTPPFCAHWSFRRWLVVVNNQNATNSIGTS